MDINVGMKLRYKSGKVHKNGTYSYEVVVKVTEVTPTFFAWEVVEILSESNKPEWDKRSLIGMTGGANIRLMHHQFSDIPPQ